VYKQTVYVDKVENEFTFLTQFSEIFLKIIYTADDRKFNKKTKTWFVHEDSAPSIVKKLRINGFELELTSRASHALNPHDVLFL